jgi:uncharacterized protein YkvS
MKESMRKRAMVGDVSILEEYSDLQLEEELDNHGWNAFHILAQMRKKEILKFNGAYKLRNKKGQTAVEILLNNSEINDVVLAKYFPWYSIPEGETVEESIKNIKETSSAEKFILSII